jgi:hypothetical protein
VGGILVFFGGGALLLLGARASFVLGFVPPQSYSVGLGIVGVLLGLGISVLAFSVVGYPQYHEGIGALILVFGLVSFVSDGGFLLGLALALAGSILMMTWTPASPFYLVPLEWRVCERCGDVYKEGGSCPSCSP